ncbi:MAG TPA: thrombospondin type 3 repeat-containing protein, partial [Thermoleophilia bacterium]|nr:thrombospondin type 3 repeat-containing protein [Thermoleophilia bacterium]
MTRAIITLALLLVCVGARGALAQAPEHTECDAGRPGVLDARLTVALSKTVAGEYRYDYFIYNPATSTGCLYGANLDVSDTRPADNVVALPPLLRLDDRGGYPVEGQYSGALVPGGSGLLGGLGRVGWTYHMKFDRATHEVHDSDVIRPGETLYVLSVVTPNPPVFRNYTLYTYWRQTGTDTPFALQSDVDVLGRVLGPGTGPCFPDTDGDGVCDDVDNCPAFPNLEQLDADEDGVGDICADGVFDGGGQRPRDVNKFLTYARPLAARTE